MPYICVQRFDVMFLTKQAHICRAIFFLKIINYFHTINFKTYTVIKLYAAKFAISLRQLNYKF